MSWTMYFLVGLVVLVLSGYGAIHPHKSATFLEQIDAIGSKRRYADVEPANWNVILTRITSLLMAIASGVFVILMLGTSR